ncbi:MAG: mechanosensitive ion channel domain-containing protein, partial [Syntrophobacteria bacterium]
ALCLYTRAVVVGLALILVVAMNISSSSAAQEAGVVSPGSDTPYAELSSSLEETLKVEKENIRHLREQLDFARHLGETLQAELSLYKVQLSAHRNLLLLPSIRIDDLERTHSEHLESLKKISQKLEERKRNKKAVESLRRRTEEQLALNEKQVKEIKAEEGKDAFIRKLFTQLELLDQLLSTKAGILAKIDEMYEKQIELLDGARENFSVLSAKFDERITESRKENLFQSVDPLAGLGWKSIRNDLTTLAKQIGLLLSGDFWLAQVRSLWKPGRFSLIAALLVLVVFQFLLVRLRRFCILLQERPFCSQYPWRAFTIELFHRSVLLIGPILFLYGYSQLALTYSTLSFLRLAMYVLAIWVFSRWALDFLTLWNRYRSRRIPEPLVSRLRVLVITCRFFAVAYVLLQITLSRASGILFLGRICLEVWLLVWSVPFWKAFLREAAQSFLKDSRWFEIARPFVIGLGYTIAAGGLLVELTGYGQLALYWYASWGRTGVVGLWASLFFFVLRECEYPDASVLDSDAKDHERAHHLLRWFLVRLCWLAWLGALCISLFLAWGAKHFVIVGFFHALSRPIHVGKLHFSILGFVYALLILLLTHMGTRLWRQRLRQRLLADSGLGLGVQESITTISVYLLWAFGILLSFYTIGLSTTSLTVAFGALGIGLGFGLQNIFNNLVSGLILLFERPIQIGDVVEVNGIWGTVTKMNVRSTVVQSFDNASLIIPNSEFISRQLTNWSFKDLRLRRTITVGVAYGSDIEVVRQTLLEIAHNHPRVLKDPEPDVLFQDFGDSALIFTLRVWTTIAYCLSAETDIRFEIDRLFRERNIQIPFPQRDLHIRSPLHEESAGGSG